MKLKNNIKSILESIINCYSIIFFSDKKFFSFLLLIVSFFDYFAGLNGLIAVIVANGTAYLLGFDRYKIRKGFYGFNSLLIGLGIGMSYEFSGTIILILIICSVMILFLTVALEALLGKYYLPFLSIPFLFGFWGLLLMLQNELKLPLSTRGENFFSSIFYFNGTFASVNDWFSNLYIPELIGVYFKSLGAIFFQTGTVAGIIIAFGILYSSRISFTLSIIGYLSSYYFYSFLGINFGDVHYVHIGFNYILTAIAIGGYFLIPSRLSYLWAVLLVPLTVIITLSLNQIFMSMNLAMYSLSFNIIVLLFLYSLKLRIFKSKELAEVSIQQNQPERNLYSYLNNNYRFKNNTFISLRLPFYGDWSVSQGHNGEFTHKDKWKYAWDFVIKDNEGKTYRNGGNNPEDYYCYNKAVLSSADGTVHEIIDGIPDNRIKEVNLEQNWGNTIIIKHTDNFYTKLSHLKQGSFKVNTGDYVKAGQMIALCGSSGRSPEPHLHFQLQSKPEIEAPSVDFPVGNYILKNKGIAIFKSYERPNKNDLVSNLELNTVLKNSFEFKPGGVIRFELENKEKRKLIEWEIITDINNYSYLWCKDSDSVAYFRRNGSLFYFYHFKGDRKSLLYYFFLALYKVPLGFYNHLATVDSIPVDLFMNRLVLFFQDFIAPFKIFVKSDYNLVYTDVNDSLNPSEIDLTAKLKTSVFGLKLKKYDFNLQIDRNGFKYFLINTGHKKIKAICIEQHH